MRGITTNFLFPFHFSDQIDNDEGIVHIYFDKSTTLLLQLILDEISLACEYRRMLELSTYNSDLRQKKKHFFRSEYWWDCGYFSGM